MRGGALHNRYARGAIATALLLCASLALAACAPTTYAGISLKSGANDPALRSLAQRARAGDQQAQLELGIRFEAGRGLPRDLDRAAKLYWDAATVPSKRRMALYLPRKGGGGFVKTFPPELELSGNDEALLRWHRLRFSTRRSVVEARRELAAMEPPTAGNSRQGYSGLPEDHEEAARFLEGFHAFQPIFNGLKGAEGSWRHRIVAEPGARFFTTEAVADSFAAIMAVPAPTREKPTSTDIFAFCAGALAKAGNYASDDRRLAGLCALAQCSAVSKSTWQSLASSVAMPAASGEPAPRGGASRSAAGEDAAFLLRVSALCGERETARLFAAAAAQLSKQVTAELQSCTRRSCSSNERLDLYRERLSADMHLLFAMAETDLVPVELAAEAARSWIDSRLPAPVPEGQVDDSIASLCERAAVEPADCRRRYPHSFFLEQKYLHTVANALAQPRTAPALCPLLTSFREIYRLEIEYRFQAAPSSTRLHFAPRCSQSGTL